MKFTKYRRKAISEGAPWNPTIDLTNVSISPEDKAAGSPKAGDMILRNPQNHNDKWLVAAAYFAANFAPMEEENEDDHEGRQRLDQ